MDECGIVPAALPAADVYETRGEYVFELEVPGFDEKELAVELTDHTLCVKGTRTEEKETKEKAFRLQERLAKTFERRFELPPEADAENLDAGFTKGVLTVHAPKKTAKRTGLRSARRHRAIPGGPHAAARRSGTEVRR